MVRWMVFVGSNATHPTAHQTEVSRFLELHDANNDGRIQWSEFSTLVETHFWEQFAECDVDGDGFLSEDELQAGLTRLGCPLPPLTLRLFFQQVRESGASTVSFEEFVMAFFTSLSLKASSSVLE